MKLKHGMNQKGNRHPVYRAWENLKARCLNPNDTGYKDYGGRGISVCDRWLNSFENFRDDMLPTWQKRLQLDRIDNNGNYEPANCRWATVSQNMKNRRCKATIQSQYPGVSWNKGTKSWQFTLTKNHFGSEEEAFLVFSKLKTLLGDL